MQTTTKQKTVRIILPNGQIGKLTVKLYTNLTNATGKITFSYIDDFKSTSWQREEKINDIRFWLMKLEDYIWDLDAKPFINGFNKLTKEAARNKIVGKFLENLA